MKKLYLLTILVFTSYIVNAQLVPCRPRMCLIDYNFHNDSFVNADMTRILGVKPDILIDNTQGGYWGGKNGHRGCIPSYYTPSGIKVFSYISGGYEGTKYMDSIDNLTVNLARVDAIAADSATGVFLDEVTNFPNTADMAYISAIYNRCILRGLQLIVNPGLKDFDPWLMSRCHYLMSDEGYNGWRAPSPSERPYLSRILVVADTVNNSDTAAAISLGARDNGFGYSYACDTYTYLPVWLNVYDAQMTTSPDTPMITLSGFTLHSDAVYGNQWYRLSSGAIAGANAQNYSPTSTGTYYSIVTLDGCGSDTSNMIPFLSTGVVEGNRGSYSLYPNPASDAVMVNMDAAITGLSISIYDVAGRLIMTSEVNQSGPQINIAGLNNGVYVAAISYDGNTEYEKLIIRR